MSLFLKLIAVFKASFPMPDFKDAKAILAWLVALNEPLADLVAALAGQLLTTGRANIDLPDGSTVELRRGPDGRLSMSESHQGRLCAAAAVGADGKWLNMFKEFLPMLLQLLSLFGVMKPVPPTA